MSVAITDCSDSGRLDAFFVVVAGGGFDLERDDESNFLGLDNDFSVLGLRPPPSENRNSRGLFSNSSMSSTRLGLSSSTAGVGDGVIDENSSSSLIEAADSDRRLLI